MSRKYQLRDENKSISNIPKLFNATEKEKLALIFFDFQPCGKVFHHFLILDNFIQADKKQRILFGIALLNKLKRTLY